MKTKSMILSAAAVFLLLVLPYASAQQPGYNAIPTNLPGVTTAPAPPSGFDPLTASDGELATYGFPPRPDRNVSARAYAAWEGAMKASKHRISPMLKLTNIFHKPNVAVGTIQNSQAYSTNWSAYVVPTSATSYGSTSIQSVIGLYVVPIAEQALGTCTGGTDYEATWVGIDGWGSNDVLQGGVTAEASCFDWWGAVSRSSAYYAWYEWYPAGSVQISNFPVSPGDDIWSEVVATSSSTGYLYMTNLNTNYSVQLYFSAPPGTNLIGNSAEWVVERPLLCWGVFGCSFAQLTNYTWEVFTDGQAFDGYGYQSEPGSSGAIAVTMLDNSGNPISYPILMGLYGIQFEDEGSARY